MYSRVAVVTGALLLAGCANTPPAEHVVAQAASQKPPIAGDVYEFANVSKHPRPRFQPMPGYPDGLLRKWHGDGDVVVDFIVNKHGAVKNAHAIQATNADFAYLAVDAVRQWQFDPGYMDGRRVNIHMRVSILIKRHETLVKHTPNWD